LKSKVLLWIHQKKVYVSNIKLNFFIISYNVDNNHSRLERLLNIILVLKIGSKYYIYLQALIQVLEILSLFEKQIVNIYLFF